MKNFTKPIWMSAILMFVLANVGWGQVIAWEPNGVTQPISSGWNATTNDANLNTSYLYRGLGIDASSLINAFSSNNFSSTTTSKTIAINRGEYLYFAIQAKSGYEVSLSTLDVNFRRSAHGPNTFQW